MDKKYLTKNKGITLVALVVTIIVLIILAGISINLILGENGIITKANKASTETIKQEATEKMNLKISALQISSYIEKQEMPNLQELADGLCEDNEIEYVLLESQKTASADKIVVGNANSIFTKLREYPYEFEINSSLQLASIDGVQVATNNDNVSIGREEYEELISSLQKKPVFIRKELAETTKTVPAKKWTELETVSLSGHGTGNAIVTFSATSGDNYALNFNIDMKNQNGTLLAGDGAQYSESTTWRRASTSLTIPYDENTKLKLRAYTDSEIEIMYSYSIVLFED